MLRTRGYTDLAQATPAFGRFQCIAAVDPATGGRVRCLVSDRADSFNKIQTTEMVQDPSFSPQDHYIFLIKNMTNQAGAILKDRGVRFEVLQPEEVLYNKMEYRWVPRYRRLTDAEVRELESACHTPRDKFPVLLASDPISRYMGFQAGQVLEICRKGPYPKRTYRTVRST